MKYNFDEKINRNNTYSLKWDYQDGDYLPMWIADMDFAAPPKVLEALHERVEHGVFGYLLNEWQLNDTIIHYYRKNYNVEIDPEWIVWIGSVMVGSNLACRMAGGDILYNVPMYNHIRELAEETDKNAIEVPLIEELKDGKLYYHMDFEAMDRMLTKETSTFVLCNPHNPVGRVYTKEELHKVSDFCKKHDLFVISDEIHSDLILDGEHTPAFMVDEWMKMNSITFSSAAKTYNLPALPTAFAIIPNTQLRERFLKTIRGLMSCANALSVTAIHTAYEECDDWKEELLSYLRTNRDYLEVWACENQIPITHLEGTYLPWMDMRKFGIDNIWKYLRDEAGVNYGNGIIYGREGYLRVNIGCPLETLKEALEKTKKALDKIR